MITLTPADWAIQTDGLVRDFGSFRAVAGVDLRVPRGCFYGFLGPNGAGKSTTIKMLTGLLRPTAGGAKVLGLDLERDLLAIKRRIGVVPEGLALFERLTAREYLMFVGRMHGLDRETILHRSAELIDLMDLEGAAGSLVAGYSTGMRKKLAVAATLLHAPDVYFLDEPFEGIDAIVSRQIRDALQLVVARGATVFLTSHILEIVDRLCTHVGIIDRGRLIADGPVEDYRKDGQHRTVEEIFLELVGADERKAESLTWLGGGG